MLQHLRTPCPIFRHRVRRTVNSARYATDIARDAQYNMEIYVASLSCRTSRQKTFLHGPITSPNESLEKCIIGSRSGKMFHANVSFSCIHGISETPLHRLITLLNSSNDLDTFWHWTCCDFRLPIACAVNCAVIHVSTIKICKFTKKLQICLQ